MIGKNLVGMMLEGAGFEVIDLGVDVSPEKYVRAVREHHPDLVGCSALLTTTMPRMQDILLALQTAGLRDRVKVMIGGAPVTEQYAMDIGADIYAPDAARCPTCPAGDTGMTSGIVFDIKEFTVHDGPGIRTTVSLKGCPLACMWCHNPESQSMQPQIICSPSGERLAGTEYSAEELAFLLNQPAELLRSNEGGITFSGGEPLFQAEFVAEVIDLLMICMWYWILVDMLRSRIFCSCSTVRTWFIMI